MSGYLLDTNVISELIKPAPHPNVVRWVEETDEATLFLSVLTLGEIRNGIDRLGRGRLRSRLQSWLERDLKVRFRGRILDVDEATAERWGALSALAAAQGKPAPVIDGLLAATALRHGLTLVTRDTAALAGAGAPTLNPWQ